MLSESRKLRAQIGEQRSLTVTERNLGVLCQTLRAGLHDDSIGGNGQPKPSRATLLAFAIIPLLVGGAAGAVIRGAGNHGPRRHLASAASASTSSKGHTPTKRGGKTDTAGGTSTSGTATSANGRSSSTLTVVTEGDGTGVIAASDGTIDCGEACADRYATGTRLTLTASPAKGSRQAVWGGACAGTATEACQITMSSDRSVTADFQRVVKLNISKSGNGTGTIASTDGGIACGSTCSAEYEPGTTVTLQATGAEGSDFNGWSGACSGPRACEVTLNDEETSVGASFSIHIG